MFRYELQNWETRSMCYACHRVVRIIQRTLRVCLLSSSHAIHHTAHAFVPESLIFSLGRCYIFTIFSGVVL